MVFDRTIFDFCSEQNRNLFRTKREFVRYIFNFDTPSKHVKEEEMLKDYQKFLGMNLIVDIDNNCVTVNHEQYIVDSYSRWMLLQHLCYIQLTLEVLILI